MHLVNYRDLYANCTGSGLEISHVETGDHVYTFKTASACPVVAWAPIRYCLAYGDLGVLRIVGLDIDKRQG